MRIDLRLLVTFLIATCATIPAAAVANECDVSSEQRAIANQLDWQTFDQAGGVEGSFRNLTRSGCYAEAIAAYRAWLKHHGKFPNKRAEGIGFFHIGQSLAFTGNREGAVLMFKRALRDEAEEGAPAADWNAYVDGVLGYFDKDKARIVAAQERLRSSDRAFARRQVDVLDGLRRCINKPYSEAMSNACRR